MIKKRTLKLCLARIKTVKLKSRSTVPAVQSFQSGCCNFLRFPLLLHEGALEYNHSVNNNAKDSSVTVSFFFFFCGLISHLIGIQRLNCQIFKSECWRLDVTWLCKIIPIHDYQRWITDAPSPLFIEGRGRLYTGYVWIVSANNKT